jgi:polyisoprenoid-binding protein YceI
MTTATQTRPPLTATATATRATGTRGGSSPRSGTWVINSTRAVAAFSGKASFLAPTINARFLGVEGSVEVVETSGGLAGAFDVAVDVRSMTTATGARDGLIRSADPFGADQFPVAVYRSTQVEWTDGRAHIDGTLTLRGVTRSVPLIASYVVARGGERMLVRAAGTIDRAAFGVSFEPGGGRLVPRVMRLAIDVDVALAA